MLRVFTDRRCLQHKVPAGYPETVERLVGMLERLRREAWAVVESLPRGDAASIASRLHDADYIERFRRAVERGDGLLDSADNPLTATTWDAACGALEAALTAADWIAEEPKRQAFVAIRPPGHHAEKTTAMGFCYFNNIAVTAQYLIDRHGFDKLAIVDFDVHHGNGTQHLFEDRSDVLFISLHQYPFYPGTGAATEVGRGAGRGATLNIPLSAGADDTRYQDAFERQLLPALQRFEPELLLVSAGFDAWQDDPLGGMQVTLEGFTGWGRWLQEVADTHCQGRLLATLEGGYDLAALGDLAIAFLAGLEQPTDDLRA